MENQNPVIAQLLMTQNGFDLKTTDAFGRTMLACVVHIPEIIKLALEHTSSEDLPGLLEHKDMNGGTILMEAVSPTIVENVEIVELLLSYGAIPNVRYPNNLTLLQTIALSKEDRSQMIKLLLTNGALLDDLNETINPTRRGVPRYDAPRTVYSLITNYHNRQAVDNYELTIIEILKTIKHGGGWQADYDRYMPLAFQREMSKVYELMEAAYVAAKNHGQLDDVEKFLVDTNHVQMTLIPLMAMEYIPAEWLELNEKTAYHDEIVLVNREGAPKLKKPVKRKHHRRHHDDGGEE